MSKRFAIYFGLITAAFCMIFGVNAYCANETIRVGLVTGFSGISSVGIGGQSVMVGSSSGSSFSEIEYFDFSGGATVEKSNGYYVAVGGSFGSYAEAKAYGDAQTGYNIIPAYVGSGMWRAYLGAYDTNENAVLASGKFPGGGTVCAPKAVTVYIKGGNDRMIYDGDSNFAIAGDSVTNLGGGSYRGYIELYPAEGSFTAVNVVPLESYLCGVVPAEMPSGWGSEALKAQAVAARTYTVNKVNSGGETAYYNICDNTHCQMYTGTKAEAETATAAVKATEGQVITYGGELINAVYCSSAGGVTDDCENVWGNSVPYLKSVEEIEGAQVVEWNRSFTFSELSSLLSQNGADIGKLVYVSVVRSDNGRVYSMTFTGEKSSYTIQKEDIKTFFSPLGGSLKDRVFDISLNYDNGDGQFTLTIDGKGWGHGLGLSQYGAASMAAAGYSYEDIVKHYYTGVELSSY